MVGRPPAVLRKRLGAAALVAAIAGYYAVFDELPGLPLWADVLLVAAAVIPASFGLVWLALPLRLWRGVLPAGLALALLAAVWHVADAGIAANFAKLGAAAAIAFWFLTYFERLSWVVAVAAMIPVVDALSVWRGPTHHIVTEEPAVFDALSYAVPAPREAFALGLPDVLFFALFLAAAARWSLRVGATWAAMIASFAVTMALAVWADPFGIGGLPALPGLSIAFLAANADVLWRRLRARDD